MLRLAALVTEARMTVAVRTDQGAAEVRALAKAAVTPEQARRLLAIALILEGASRAEAARSTRHGPADAARLGAPLQRRRAGRVWSTARRRAGNGGWTRRSSGLAWRAAPSRPCRGDPRPGGLAWRQGAAGARQHQPAAAAAYSPELNPVENLWQFIKHTSLNARIFASYDAIVAACCDAWNRLRAIPGQIRSITTRDWAKTVIL